MTDLNKEAARLVARRRRRRVLPALFLVAVGLVAIAPNLVAMSPLRDLVARAFFNWRGPLQCESASLGWFSPVQFRQVAMQSPPGSLDIRLPLFASTEPLWKFVFNAPDLGTVQLTHAEAVLRTGLAREPDSPPPPRGRVVQVAIEIDRARLAVADGATNGPAIPVSEVSLRAHLERSGTGGQQFTLQPGRLIDHGQVAAPLCHGLLKYIAPVLANAAWARGEFSLEVDQLRIELDDPAAGDFRGRFVVHAIEAGGKSPLMQKLGQILEVFFPGRVPQTIKLVSNSTVEFELERRGIRHRDFAFGLPELSPGMIVHTSGWVGFDQSLDLTAEIPLPGGTAGLDGTRAPKSIRLQIGGTLAAPKIQLAKREGGPPASALDAIERILGRAQEEEPVAQQIVEGILDAGAALKQKQAQRPPGEPGLGGKIVKKGLPKLGKAARRFLEKQLGPQVE